MKQRSLKWALITSLILAMAVPLAVTGTLFTRILADAMKQRIISVNESLSYSFIDQIDAYLNNALNDLSTLRTMVEKQDFEMLNYTSLLDSIRHNKEHFTKIQIINRDGYIKFISPYHKDWINLDMSRNKIFTEPVRTGSPYWSPAFIASDSGHSAVSLSIPFENGVMTGFLSLANLRRAAEKIAHGKNIHITITDQTSSFIVHHMEAQVYQRGFDANYDRFRESYKDRQLITDVISHQGKEMFITAGMIPKTEWSIVFYQPVEEVFYPIRLFYTYMVLGFAFLTGVTILLCLKHINLVISTIEKFTRYARVIARGQYGKGTLPVQYREFSELSNQFSAMADAVRTRERKLRENQERYRSIFNAAKDAILIADAQTGRILDVNAFACDLFDYPRKKFLTLSMTNISARPGQMKRILGREESWIPECPLLKADKSTFTAELSISFFTPPGTHTVCTIVARDITQRIAEHHEKERMQKMLGHAQKMEAIGRLAGGIAHDFNNILTAIVGYAELSRTKAPEGSPLVKYTTRVLTAAQRAKELVDQILTFARTSRAEKKPVQVNLILNEVNKFIRASIPASIDIKTDITSDHWVMADPIQLHQVIMNLCTNAWHAMKETGGTLTLTLGPLDTPVLNPSGDFLPGKTLRLTVGDTGHGIAPEDLTKIFDPYFTTKAAGEGTGMGLSVVQGILRDMAGHIEVKSTPGQGTVFTILLPAAEVTDPESIPEAVGVKGGDETILVVDDEKEITRVMKLILSGLGYRVETRNDPRQALSYFKEDPDRFDLVISDMTMPGISGKDLAEELMALRPDLPIIICTGFHESMTQERAEAMGIKTLLFKPVEKGRLAAAIRDALDKENPEAPVANRRA